MPTEEVESMDHVSAGQGGLEQDPKQLLKPVARVVPQGRHP
jgi:hypothetical protein